MKKSMIILGLLLMAACTTLFAKVNDNTPQIKATDAEDLALLKEYIRQKPHYDLEKEQRILELTAEMEATDDRYNTLRKLFDEYKSYNFDRAIVCVEQLYDEAVALGIQDKIVYAQVQKGFAYLSAGLFKEGFDLFYRLDTVGASNATKAEYCMTYARLLYDLSDYNNVGMTHSYNLQGNDLLRKALRYLTPRDTINYWNCQAIIDQHEGFYDRAITRFKLAMESSEINEHQLAINYSTIAYLYQLLGNTNMQRHYDILAAISDIKSSTKETVAMRIVADNLNKEGNIEDAGICIRCAQEDAVFYNARHRQVEISQILPIIEQENIRSLEAQKKQIYVLVITIVLLLGICLLGIWMLRRQNRTLKKVRQTIEDTNSNLLIANKIKEEYIGNFLCWQSEFITDLDKYEHQVKKLAMQHKFEELQNIPKNVDAGRKREDFYKRFDEMFLNIFPNFVKDFNALLRPDEAIELKEGELLSTDLRIFALMRLGITHNEVIAQVLDYSVNTIYSYKTKVKNRSNLDNDRFLEAVMAIPSFKQTEMHAE